MFGIDDLINAGAAAFGASEAAGAAEDAARAQELASKRGIKFQREMFKRQRRLEEPFRLAGVKALNQLMPFLQYKNFGMKQFKADPGYAFRLAEGQKALERSAAARGGLLSGATLKGTERFGQDLASQEYQNAFQRYLAEREQQIAPRFDVARLGQSAASNTAASAGTYGANVSNLMQDIGAARASGYVGSANALNQALSGALNYFQNNQLINALNRPSTYSSGNGGGGGLKSQLSELGVF